MNKEAAYAQYDDIISQVSKETRLCGPHCDSRILHRAEECKHCGSEKFKELHESRKILGINYTGEHHADLLTCPAEDKRSLTTINKWYGNVKDK